MARGHEVSVLAPADDDTPVPDYLTSAGGAVPVRYNGSVARLTFGPRTAGRVRRWLDAGRFDVLHLHEPVTPSLSMLALWIAQGPIVATFHTSLVRSRALQVAYPLVRQSLRRSTRGSPSRRTRGARSWTTWAVTPSSSPTACTSTRSPTPCRARLGRARPRRRRSRSSDAWTSRARACRPDGRDPADPRAAPGARFLVAGRGDDGRDTAIEALGAHASSVEFLGGVSDEDKASLLASVDLYIAPQTGASFGIVLVEAMSAGACVVASDLGAFRRVLDDGAAGVLFPVGDPEALARAVVDVLADPDARAEHWRARPSSSAGSTGPR